MAMRVRSLGAQASRRWTPEESEAYELNKALKAVEDMVAAEEKAERDAVAAAIADVAAAVRLEELSLAGRRESSRQVSTGRVLAQKPAYVCRQPIARLPARVAPSCLRAGPTAPVVKQSSSPAGCVDVGECGSVCDYYSEDADIATIVLIQKLVSETPVAKCPGCAAEYPIAHADGHCRVMRCLRKPGGSVDGHHISDTAAAGLISSRGYTGCGMQFTLTPRNDKAGFGWTTKKTPYRM